MTQANVRLPDAPETLTPSDFPRWILWAKSLVRTVSDNLSFAARNYQQINAPHTLPNVIVTQLVGAAAIYKASTGGRLVYVTDAAGTPVVAYSDGTTWRRIDTNAIVS